MFFHAPLFLLLVIIFPFLIYLAFYREENLHFCKIFRMISNQPKYQRNLVMDTVVSKQLQAIFEHNNMDEVE